MGDIVGQLLVRGADSIVADAGILADAGVVMSLEVLVQRIGDDGAQGIPHELHVGGRGRGGMADVGGHLLDVDFWGEGYRHSRAPGGLAIGARYLVAAGEVAAHYGVITVAMVVYML